jgi:hypothetical protein
MLTNSKTALSLSLALGIAALGLMGSANAQSRVAQPEYFTIQDDGNRDSNGFAPVKHSALDVDGNTAASAFAAATPRSQRVAEPESFRIQDQGNRDSNGY